MNIKEAKDVFSTYSDELTRETEHLVQFLRENGLDAPLKNNNYLHALTYTKLMFDHTDRYCSILTGGAGDGFLSALEESFCRMLRRLSNVPGKCRVILVDGNDLRHLSRISKQFPDTLEVVSASSEPGPVCVSHFMVADGEMVRKEHPHAPITDQSDASMIKADVYFNSPSIAELQAGRFCKLWKQLTA